jgi:hypothetical protein
MMIEEQIMAWFFFLGFILFLLLINAASSQGPRRSRPSQYGHNSITLQGEEVKSKSEKMIADYFTSNNIKYVYEPRLRGRYAVPDFYLPDYNVYVEFWGLLTVQDAWLAQKHEKSMKRKTAIYHKNNVKCISIYPKNAREVNSILCIL